MLDSNTPTKPHKNEPINRKRLHRQGKFSVTIIAYREFTLALHGPKPLSRPQLQEITGLANSTISRWVEFFRAAKLVYVADYKRTSDRGQWIELFSWGYNMPDATKPLPKSDAEYRATYRRKLRLKANLKQTEKGIIHVAD